MGVEILYSCVCSDRNVFCQSVKTFCNISKTVCPLLSAPADYRTEKVSSRTMRASEQTRRINAQTRTDTDWTLPFPPDTIRFGDKMCMFFYERLAGLLHHYLLHRTLVVLCKNLYEIDTARQTADINGSVP